MNITALAQASREKAKLLYLTRRFLSWLILLTGISVILMPIFLTSENSLKISEYIQALLVLVFQIIGTALFVYASRYHRLSRQGLRVAMLMDAFGKTAEPLEVANLLQAFSGKLHKRSEKFTNEYYSSTAPFGMKRLKEHLAESAFFSGHLFEVTALRIFWGLALPSLVILVLILCFPLFSDDAGLTLARCVILIAISLCTSGSIGECYGYVISSIKAKEIVQRLKNLPDSDEETIYAAFADYGVTMALCLPIPTRIYNQKKESLRTNWGRYKASCEQL